MDEYIEGWMGGWMDEYTDGWTGGRMDGWIYRRVDGDGRMDI